MLQSQKTAGSMVANLRYYEDVLLIGFGVGYTLENSGEWIGQEEREYQFD